MSIDALSWAFNLDLPNSGVKLTLLALANYADADDCTAYPNQKTISQKTCLSTRAIRSHLVTLEELGVISRKSRKREDGTFTSDLFTLNIGFSPPKSTGRNYQRQNLPTAKKDKIQRQILPNPVADSAYQEPSLDTTKANNKPSDIVPDKSGTKKVPLDTELQATCKATWKSYSDAHFIRYGIEPVRNAPVNAAIKAFCQKVPAHEAPHIATFYVNHNDKYYVQKTHPVSLMSKDAEGLRTQWATGRTMTSTRANQLDSTATNANAAQEAIAMLRRRNGNASI